MKKRSIALGLVAVLCIGGTADTLFASGVERTLSRQAAQLNGLEVAPEAYISGFPVALAAVTGAVSRVSLHSVDVPVAGVGVGNAGVELNTPALEEERDGLMPPWKYEASYD